MFKGLLNKAVNKYSGKKDFLEAAAAAGVLAARANGIDDNEIAALVDTISSMPALTSNYSVPEIEEEVEKAINRSKTAVGRAGLRREVTDVARKDITLREDVFLVAVEVASGDGIDAKEEAVLRDIANILSVNYDKLAAA
jgi:tellurite resistance protein